MAEALVRLPEVRIMQLQVLQTQAVAEAANLVFRVLLMVALAVTAAQV
jgi:hypothetical protein